MNPELTPQQNTELVHSLRKYFSTELNQELSELQAKLLLDYLFKEVAPLAYNRGVQDAEKYFRTKLEDLPSTCFEPELTYWQKKRGGTR